MKLAMLSTGLITMMAFLSGCAAEVGSEKWCVQIEKKDKGDITVNEATDYAKHCVLRKVPK